MIYRESKASVQHSRIVERFWSVDYEGSSDAPIEPVLPDGRPEIVFNLADRFQRIRANGDVETQASAIVSGQIRSRLMIRPSGRVSLFGVRFRPYGGASFLRTGMSSLTDHVIPLSDVVGGFASELEARIAQALSFEERVSIVESSIASRPSVDSDTSITAGLTEMISAAGGKMSITKLVDRTGISERRIERMFNKHVGVSPKVFSRIERFRNVVRSIETTESFRLLDTALSHGYYDQSHMIHEFNEFAGTNPSSYFDETHRLSQLFTS